MAAQDAGRTTGFPCKQCGMVCPNMPSLLEHMDAHLQQEEERKFKCDECGRGYRHAGSLANHKKTHEVGSFQCNICGKENSNALSLKSHLRSHTSQKKYSCAECGKGFRLATQLATHERVHLARRAKEQSYRKVDMEYHTHEGGHEIENDHPLHLNDYSTSVGTSTENSPAEDKAEVVYNAQAETSDDAANRPFRCDLCDKSYIHHRSLTNHKKTHQVGMFECTVCFKLFNNMAALYSHQRTHKGRSGTDPGSMDNHGGFDQQQEQIISNGHVYSDCSNNQTPSSSSTQGEPPIITTSILDSVLAHTHNTDNATEMEETSTVDSDERPFKCQICGKSYRHSGSLINHKRSHQVGIYQCSVCRKSYPHLAALKSHLRLHKAQSSSFSLNAGGDWLSPEPLTMDNQQGCFSSQEEDSTQAVLGIDQKNGVDHSNGALYHEQHTCHECGKAFKIQKQLLNHLRRHKENQAKIQELNSQIQALMQMNGTRSDGGMQSLTSNSNQAFSSPRHCKQVAEGKMAQMKSETSVKSEDTGDQRPFACDQCGRTYRHAGSLVNHRNSHKTGEYYCSVCNNTYSNQLAMKNHLRTHFAYKKHSCQNCGKGFRGKKQLVAHLPPRRLTPEPQNTHKTGHFSCTFCSKPFTNPMALRNHTRIHTQKKKYVCLTCGKAFRLASILHNHQRVHNRVASHFSCPACGKSFQGRSGLKRHRCRRGQENSARAGVLQSERGDKCFMCDLCGRSYRHAGSLLNHKKTHSENLHHCTLCLQTFPDPLSLQIHSQMRRHCCPECGKTFCLVAHLQSHMEVHSKDQAVVCSLCQQSFPNTDSYQQHHDMHHQGQGPYQQAVDEPMDDNLCWDSGINQTMGMDEMQKQVPPPLSHIPGSITDSQKGNDSAGTEEKSHVCEHCGRTYRHAGSLLNHKNSHKTG
ncbi:hypothetical protein INR49_013760, partial [Caranx melampygus]